MPIAADVKRQPNFFFVCGTCNARMKKMKQAKEIRLERDCDIRFLAPQLERTARSTLMVVAPRHFLQSPLFRAQTISVNNGKLPYLCRSQKVTPLAIASFPECFPVAMT